MKMCLHATSVGAGLVQLIGSITVDSVDEFSVGDAVNKRWLILVAIVIIVLLIGRYLLIV